MKVDSWKAFTCTVEATVVHALNYSDKTLFSILFIIVENVTLCSLLTVEAFGIGGNLVTDYRKFSAKLIQSRI